MEYTVLFFRYDLKGNKVQCEESVFLEREGKEEQAARYVKNKYKDEHCFIITVISKRKAK